MGNSDRLMAHFLLSEEGDASACLLLALPAKFIWSICVAFIFALAVLVVTTVIKGRAMKGSAHEREKGNERKKAADV